MIACFATQGTGSRDDDRIRALLEHVDAHPLPFDRAHKARSALGLVRRLARERPELVVMEGTGIAGGAAILAARTLFGVPFVVSSGDAVAPYISSSKPLLRPFAALYERLLCRRSAGYIGWTPYLAGRALTLGAPRAMTAPNWSFAEAGEGDRARIRAELRIPDGAVVFGIVGSLDWNPRVGYCYGAELVRAAAGLERDDVVVVVVGDGSGRAQLERIAGGSERVRLPGRVPRDDVPAYLAAFDVASLPQSVDGVGSFRYTTKVSEYLAAGVPVVTGQIPLAYDLDDGWLWRLPGDSPWDARYVGALRELMREVSADAIEARRAAVPNGSGPFDRARQQRQVAAFVGDLVERARGR